MFCMHCGKQISDDSVFCQYCGKRLGASKAEEEPAKGWEYLTFILHFRHGEAGWLAQESYPAPLAQQSFWNDSVPLLDELRTMMIDNGWQPVGEHGPACIELDSYKSAEGKNPVAETLNAMASYGTSLLFARNWKFTIKTITLKWRRPRKEEGRTDEEFHMWFNQKTGELERWEIDKATGKWVLLDMDENGNWVRQQQGFPADTNKRSSSSQTTNSQFLTDDELHVLEQLAKGLSNVEIANKLGLSPVYTSLMTTDMLEKFKVDNEDELVRVAREKGFISSG